MRISLWAQIPLAVLLAAVLSTSRVAAELNHEEQHSIVGRGQRPVKPLGLTLLSARGEDVAPLTEIFAKRLSSAIAPVSERSVFANDDVTVGGLRNDTDQADSEYEDEDDNDDDDDDDDDDTVETGNGRTRGGRKTDSSRKTSNKSDFDDETTSNDEPRTSGKFMNSPDRTQSPRPTRTPDFDSPSGFRTSTKSQPDRSSWLDNSDSADITSDEKGGFTSKFGDELPVSKSNQQAPSMTKSRRPEWTSSSSDQASEDRKTTYNKTPTSTPTWSSDDSFEDEPTSPFRTTNKDRTSTVDDTWRPSRTSTADDETPRNTETEARPPTTTSSSRENEQGGLLNTGSLLGSSDADKTRGGLVPTASKDVTSSVTSAPSSSSKKKQGGLLGGLNPILTSSDDSDDTRSSKKTNDSDQSKPTSTDQTKSDTADQKKPSSTNVECGDVGGLKGSGSETQAGSKTTPTSKDKDDSGGLLGGLTGGLTGSATQKSDQDKPTATTAAGVTSKSKPKSSDDTAGTKTATPADDEAGTKNITSSSDETKTGVVGGLLSGDGNGKTGKGTQNSNTGLVGGLLGSDNKPDSTEQNKPDSSTSSGLLGGLTGTQTGSGDKSTLSSGTSTTDASGTRSTQGGLSQQPISPVSASPSATPSTPANTASDTNAVGGLKSTTPVPSDASGTTMTSSGQGSLQGHGGTTSAPSSQKSNTAPAAIVGIQPNQAYGYADSGQLLMPSSAGSTTSKADEAPATSVAKSGDGNNSNASSAPATNKTITSPVANIIVPAGSAASQPANTAVVAILFKPTLSWTFLAQSPKTVAQLFGYMPSIIAECISVQPSDVSTMRLQSYYPTDDKTDVSRAQSLYLAYVPSAQVKNLAEQIKQYNQSAFYTMPSVAVAKQIVAQVDPQFDVLSMGSSVKANSDVSGSYNGDKNAKLRNALVGVGAALAACIIGFIAWRLYKRSQKASRRQTFASAAGDRATTIRSFGGSGALRETWAPSEHEQERVLHDQLAETWDHAGRNGQGSPRQAHHPEMGYRNAMGGPWGSSHGHSNPFEDVRGNRASRETERSGSSNASLPRDTLLSMGRAQQGSRGSEISTMTEAQRIQQAYMESRGSLSGSQGEHWPNTSRGGTPGFQDEYGQPQQYTTSHQHGPRTGENRTQRKRLSKGSLSGSSIGRPEMRSNSMLF